MKKFVNKRKWLLKVLVVTITVSLVFGLMPGIVGAVTPPPNWDISGDWLLDFNGGNDNREFRAMVQDKDGNVNGEFWHLSGTWQYGGTLVGYVSGNDLYLFYERPAPLTYTGDFIGTITKDGISGTFEDNKTTNVYAWSVTDTITSNTKSAILKDSGVPGKGLENAPGLNKPFNPKSQAGENAGKK